MLGVSPSGEGDKHRKISVFKGNNEKIPGQRLETFQPLMFFHETTRRSNGWKIPAVGVLD